MYNNLPLDDKQIKKLSRLQEIDSQIDLIQEKKGDLPRIIAELEQSLHELQEKTTSTRRQLDGYKQEISLEKEKAKEAVKLIQKYEEQQATTKSDQEYEAITDELDLQKLEEELAKKNIRALQRKSEAVEAQLATLQTSTHDQSAKLTASQEKLRQIHELSQDQEAALQQQREKVVQQIDPRLYEYYQTIYNRKKNAVVHVVNSACGGCNLIVPDQTQIEIKTQKWLFTCEECGRILLQVEEPLPEAPKRVGGRRAIAAESA